METKLTHKGNTSIGIFMGYERYPIEGKSDGFMVILKDGGIPRETCIASLEFHSSWEWLMPVIDKIQTLGYPCVIYIDGFMITDARDGKEVVIKNLETCEETDPLTRAWLGVVEFVERQNALNEMNRVKEIMVKNQKLRIETIHTIGQLREAIADFKDTDSVVCEIHEGVFYEDLYGFYVDEINGMATEDGKDDRTEVRLSLIAYE